MNHRQGSLLEPSPRGGGPCFRPTVSDAIRGLHLVPQQRRPPSDGLLAGCGSRLPVQPRRPRQATARGPGTAARPSQRRRRPPHRRPREAGTSDGSATGSLRRGWAALRRSPRAAKPACQASRVELLCVRHARGDLGCGRGDASGDASAVRITGKLGALERPQQVLEGAGDVGQEGVVTEVGAKVPAGVNRVATSPWV